GARRRAPPRSAAVGGDGQGARAPAAGSGRGAPGRRGGAGPRSSSERSGERRGGLRAPPRPTQPPPGPSVASAGQRRRPYFPDFESTSGLTGVGGVRPSRTARQFST